MALTAPSTSQGPYSITVLPMLPLGAPMSVVVFRDLDPALTAHAFCCRVKSHLDRFVSIRGQNVYVFFYRADLRLDMFRGETSWRFLSTLPLSQLFDGRCFAPFGYRYDTTLRDGFANAPDIATPQEPPCTLHLIAEIIEAVSNVAGLPNRFSVHRRFLRHEDPETFAQLRKFLSSPPEPLAPAMRRVQHPSSRNGRPSAIVMSASVPFYLNHVPAIARLQLPKNKMFVRPVFEKLLDEMLRDLPDKKRFVYVAGTTGAGKTAFLWYIVHALCRRGRTSCGKFLAPTMDIVLDVPGLFVLIDTAGQVFTGPRRECFRIELMKKETLYLVDLAHTDHQELLRFPTGCNDDIGDDHHSIDGHASRILVALPRHRVKFRAHGMYVAVIVLPPWKACELELCRRVCFPALSKSLLIARTKIWGRQPLRTLAMDPRKGVAEERLVEMLSDLDWVARISDVVVRNLIPDDSCAASPPSLHTMHLRDAATQLLVLRPPEPNRFFPEFSYYWWFQWSTPALHEAVLKRVFEIQNSDDAMSVIERYEWSYGLTSAVEWDWSATDEKYLFYGTKCLDLARY